MDITKQLNITTEFGENEFQVRFLKEDGVGILTTRNEKNYLILDSLDYWYDSIQNQYPKKKKCSCKNEWFNIQFNYLTRQETDDFKKIDVYAVCTNCNKKLKSLSVNIDYSPTDDLYNKPITHCNKPNIKYKFTELTSYWSENDLIAFLNYVFNELKLNVYCWFSEPEQSRKFEKVSFYKALKIINYKYLNFLFSYIDLETKEFTKLENEYGVYLDNNYWRKNEIINLSSPCLMADYGLLYYINFCNQYIEREEIIDKSKLFEDITLKLVSWLKIQFVTKRGKNCFDGEAAYNKFLIEFSK
jgi:hypothetical protein